MKTYIRRINIEERKSYIFVICLTLFHTFSAFITKTLTSKYKIEPLTIICQTGSMISLISFPRIIQIFHKKYKRDETDSITVKHNLIKGFFQFLSVSFMFLAIGSSDVTFYFVIIRLFPFVALVCRVFINDYNIERYQVFGLLASLVAICFYIMEDTDPRGFMFGLLSLISMTVANLLYKNIHRSGIEILLSAVGIYSSTFGCLVILLTRNKMDELSFNMWILIILNAFCTYYSNLFQLKVTRYVENLNKIAAFNILAIFLSVIFSSLFFGQHFNWHDGIGFAILTLNSIFYMKTVLSLSTGLNQETSVITQRESFLY